MMTITMTREEKQNAIISRDMDNIFDDYRGLEEFVAHVLKNGYEGYLKMTDEDIDGLYSDIFEEDDDE
jgi:hypothetical protein